MARLRSYKTPEEIKINKDKGQEAEVEETAPVVAETQKEAMPKEAAQPAPTQPAEPKKEKARKEAKAEPKKVLPRRESGKDTEALNLVKKYHTFGRNTPAFLLAATELVEDNQ